MNSFVLRCCVINAVDHLVNNAGVHAIALFEDTEDVTDFKSVMVKWKLILIVTYKQTV